MTETEILALLQSCGAVLDGHFLLTSGRHSGRYVQCALLLQHPRHTEQLCRELAGRLQAYAAQTVLAPALGGIVVGYEVARQLGARAPFAERDAGGRMALRRGFQLQPGERVLVVEDVCTTGGSVREVIALAQDAGAQVAAVGALVDRGGALDFGVPFQALLRLDIATYAPEDCPHSAAGTTAIKPGSRR